ncbi:hypothetical protein GCAAIG_10910 [Candidatus Electronema halotolerans]
MMLKQTKRQPGQRPAVTSFFDPMHGVLEGEACHTIHKKKIQ